MSQFLSFTICQKILEILTSTETYGYLTDEVVALLEARRGVNLRRPRLVDGS